MDMTSCSIIELREALYEVDDERKLLNRRIRKAGQATQHDTAQMNAMNEWAQQLFSEIMARAG
jgi:hypothetical protein